MKTSTSSRKRIRRRRHHNEYLPRRNCQSKWPLSPSRVAKSNPHNRCHPCRWPSQTKRKTLSKQKYLEGSKEMKEEEKELQSRECKSKEHSKRQDRNFEVTWLQMKCPLHLNGLFGNWRELKRCPNFLHHDTTPLTHGSHLQYVPTPWVIHMHECYASAAHTCRNRKSITFVFNVLSNGQTRAELSNIEASLTKHVRTYL